MAKISRRAVASSSSSSSSSASTLGATSSGSSLPSGSNNIAYSGKPSRNAPAGEHSSKSIGENNGPNTTALYADPLRNNSTYGSQHHTTVSSQRGPFAATSRSYEQNSSYTGHPALIEDVGGATISPLPPYGHNKTIQSKIIDAERERIRAEFFATYDVMTGVRIAATLSGFFGLMVFLIVWKSRSSSNETLKVLKDPKMAAVAAVCMQEEEEREIQEAMVATGMSIYPDEYDAIAYRRQRMLSLGNVSAPPMLNRGYRFSSVGGGGYSSLLEPPRRFSYSAISTGGATGLIGGRRKSGSESSRILSNFPMGSSFGTDDYFIETEDEIDNGEYPQIAPEAADIQALHKRTDSRKSKHGFLEVPLMGQDSRRSSAMTCCSTDSSYLERRCSAYTLGLSNLPPSLQRKLSTASRTSSTDNWDYYYPDIQVIQPTPKPSPCPSERSIYEQLQDTPGSTTTLATVASQVKAKLPTTTTATTTATATATTIATTISPTTTNKTAKSSTIERRAEPPTFVRKHSIAYYDPESAQAGRKQQIHSISADTVNMYPYNQGDLGQNNGFAGGVLNTPVQSAPPVGVHNVFHFADSLTDELCLNVRRKVTVVELQPRAGDTTPPVNTACTYENNNIFPYTNSVAAKVSAALVNSSSISVDSTPVSIDKLNGSCSLGTVSGKALFNVEKRAPLASLSSFKISSLEIQDSEMRSLDDNSVFLDSVADTDEDMQQFSSDSEEASLASRGECLAQENDSLVPSTPHEQPTTSHNNQSTKCLIEKRFSLGSAMTATANSGPTGSRTRRSLLERNRTISGSSSDRISLIGRAHQPRNLPRLSRQASDSQTTPMVQGQGPATPHETHFGSVICTNSPPMHPRRAQLLQQYSDPQSLPTTTTTTTTTNTEEDTCSTLNTEVVCAGTCEGYSTYEGDCGSVAGGSTTYTQHSSLNTVISFGRISPQRASGPLNSNTTSTGGPNNTNTTQLPSKQQLPTTTSKLIDEDERCASSISDSVINTRQTVICMPSSLKNLILRGTASPSTVPTGLAHSQSITVSRSDTNLSFFGSDTYGAVGDIHCPSVMLELPLIKLPTDDSSESSNGSVDMERSKSDESRDPSIPGSSRKWSKETLF